MIHGGTMFHEEMPLTSGWWQKEGDSSSTVTILILGGGYGGIISLTGWISSFVTRQPAPGVEMVSLFTAQGDTHLTSVLKLRCDEPIASSFFLGSNLYFEDT